MSEQPTLEQRIAALRARYDQLRRDIALEDVTRKLGDIATEIAGLPGAIAGLRQRGYAFAGYLENKAEVLSKQWEEVRQQVQQAVQQEVERGQRQISELDGMWQALEKQWSNEAKQKNANLLELALDTAQKAVEGARGRIEGLYGQVPVNVSQTKTQLNQIAGYLDLAAESTAGWLPGEAIVMAHKGEWKQTGKDKQDPDGILYLTDKRLIFEQKEKVGGRFGFGGEQVQQVLFAVPVGTIREATAEKQGMLGGIDLVNLKLSGGEYAEMILEVKGGIDCRWYVQQLNRVISGEIEKERAIPVESQAAQDTQQVPTACPTCGASLPPLVRGVTELRCEYCGTVVRV